MLDQSMIAMLFEKTQSLERNLNKFDFDLRALYFQPIQPFPRLIINPIHYPSGTPDMTDQLDACRRDTLDKTQLLLEWFYKGAAGTPFSESLKQVVYTFTHSKSSASRLSVRCWWPGNSQNLQWEVSTYMAAGICALALSKIRALDDMPKELFEVQIYKWRWYNTLFRPKFITKDMVNVLDFDSDSNWFVVVSATPTLLAQGLENLASTWQEIVMNSIFKRIEGQSIEKLLTCDNPLIQKLAKNFYDASNHQP